MKIKILTFIFLFCSSLMAKEIDQRVLDSVEQLIGRTPSKQAVHTIRTYHKYIEYFCSLPYTRVKFRVSPVYVYALICTESNGNPTIVSVDDACGLTQILPETGRRWARELYDTGYNFKYIDERRLKNLTKNDLFDPAINLLLACYGTDKHNAMFNGEFLKTAAAWNAGHNAVLRYDGCPPYKETIRFVGKVNGLMNYFLQNPGVVN